MTALQFAEFATSLRQLYLPTSFQRSGCPNFAGRLDMLPPSFFLRRSPGRLIHGHPTDAKQTQTPSFLSGRGGFSRSYCRCSRCRFILLLPLQFLESMFAPNEI